MNLAAKGRLELVTADLMAIIKYNIYAELHYTFPRFWKDQLSN